MQVNTKLFWRGAVLFSLMGVVSISACSKKTRNPLLDATDGQFIQAMSFSITECEEIFFNPAAVRHPRPNDRQNCAHKVKENAAFAGISQVVALENIDDPRVKERYFKLQHK